MREIFRNNMPKGAMKTKYWIDKKKGEFSHWHTDVETLKSDIIGIVDYYDSIDIKLTNRQLYYQLVGKDLIPNAQEVYKRICVFITDMRYNGYIDWNTIEDKARVPKRPPQWKSIKELGYSASEQFRLPRTSDQDTYIEMYCEKEAGINVLETISNKYHLYFGFNKGYSSAAAMYQLAKRISRQITNGKKVKILYFGDHDPSGLDMIRDIEDRIKEFLTEGNHCYDISRFEVIPVALTQDQIDYYSPPPNPAKITDPRAKWYLKVHGDQSWELDALDALELRDIAEKAVLSIIDLPKYESWIDKEEEDVIVFKDLIKDLDEE